MYPPPERNHNKSCTPREFVDALDQLILARLMGHEGAEHNIVFRGNVAEEIELIKRQLTDYLIATSPERGMAVHGEH